MGTRMNWTEMIAMMPDAVVFSEAQRRRAQYRQTYTGGIYWKEHNAEVANCRCRDCMAQREQERDAMADPAKAGRGDLDKRNKIRKLRAQGKTYQAIATELGLTRQRIHQLLHT